MNGFFQYKHPNTSIFQDEDVNTKAEIRDIIGTLKLANDPKVDLIKDENMIYFGSQLTSSWVFGIVLYNGTNTKALREAKGRFRLSKLLENKQSLINTFYNRIALAITVFCVLISFVSYISTFSQTSSSNFLEKNNAFPHITKLKRFFLYFVNSSVSVSYLIPLINSISNYLQFKQVQKYNTIMQKKKEEKIARAKQDKIDKEEREKKAL